MAPSKVNLAVEEDQKNLAERRKQGEFVRGISTARNRIGSPEFPPEPNRYHLFVAFNCPWCHRVSLSRGILGLEASITMDVCFPNRFPDPDGESSKTLWVFAPEAIASSTNTTLSECTYETATGKSMKFARDIYRSCGIMDQTSVPILYDKKTHKIVSNESADIVRMLSEHSQALGAKSPLNLYPVALRENIDALNGEIYVGINNGAYKAGFSSNQTVYNEAYNRYFKSLDSLESQLSANGGPFLLGRQLTEADVRLYPTLYRHDPVYYTRMKLNRSLLATDYPNLMGWLQSMYAIKGVPESCSLVHCKQGYFGNSWNNVVPLGPTGYPEKYLRRQQKESLTIKVPCGWLVGVALGVALGMAAGAVAAGAFMAGNSKNKSPTAP